MAEIARGKRFSLLAISGFAINPGYMSSSRESISYCIVDRDWTYREVWRNYSNPEGRDARRFVRRATAFDKLHEFEGQAAEMA
jgi:hypothetical protein